MKKVLILGEKGMLATALQNEFHSAGDIAYRAIGRSTFDADHDEPKFDRGYDYIINAIGVIKPYIDETNFESVRRAVSINSMFPIKLRALNPHPKIIQIATDCVYSGREIFPYRESHLHDADDIYGKTKSLGEVKAQGFYNLRTSIIGPEAYHKKSLLEWFLSQPKGAVLKGFTNHVWNGITTKAFARICVGIVRQGFDLPNVLHVVPRNNITKYALLKLFQAHFNKDCLIEPVAQEKTINRTLDTSHLNEVNMLWSASGYPIKPTIQDLVSEL